VLVPDPEEQAKEVRLRALEAQLRGENPEPDGHVIMLLSDMKPGQQGHILEICCCCEARQHLLEMGFTAGTPLELLRVAPMGDPMTVRVRGYQLSLRRSEAMAITVRRCPPEELLELFTPPDRRAAEG